MTKVNCVIDDGLRVIMCLAIDHGAPATQVAVFKTMLLQCKSVLNLCELTGTFDLILEVALPDMLAYNQWFTAIDEPIDRLVVRHEASFVCKRFVRVPKTPIERAIWVPCHEGLKRLDCLVIDKITAEGDYIRVHTAGESWMVHMTMHEALDRLGDQDFIHVHRSTILRCTFIERLLHQERIWHARLNDGTIERIAKSHVHDVLVKLGIDSSKLGVNSAINALNERNFVTS